MVGKGRYAQTAVSAEVIGGTRCPVSLEISRRRADHAFELEEFSDDEGSRLRGRQKNRNVNVFPDQVDQAILDPQVDLHFGVAREELRHRRHDLVHPYAHAQVHAQAPARTLARAPDLHFGILHVSEDATASRPEKLALGRRAYPARGAMDELDLQGTLEAGNELRERRGRELELARRGGETAQLDGTDEGLHLAAIPDARHVTSRHK